MNCVLFIRISDRFRIRFCVWLVDDYAHAFILIYFRCHCTVPYVTGKWIIVHCFEIRK